MDKKQIQVLLLEDEAAHAEAIRRGLESADGALKVHIVGSLKEFRDYIAVNTPDIALLDMVLPDGNGIDLLGSAPESNSFPMLILTSHGNEKAAVDALKAGALDYIVKSAETFTQMPRILDRNLSRWTLIQERKKAEEALQQSEITLHNFLDNSVMGVRIRNEDGHILYLNQSFLDIFGYRNREEAELTSPLKSYTPESYADYVRRAEKISRGEIVSNNIEVDIKRKDGTIRHLQVYGRNVVRNGKAQGQTIYNDITERIQAEAALKISEQNFRNSMDSSTMGIRIMGNVDYTIYVNQAMLDMFGYQNIDELNASPPQEHYTPESHAEFLRRKEQYARGEPLPAQLEFDIIRADGAVRNLQLSSKNVFWDGKQQFQLIYIDITERKLAEAALKESEKNLRAYLDNAPDGVYLSDLNGVLLDGNKKAEEILGYKKEELVGSNFFQLNLLPARYLEKARASLTFSAMGRNTGPDEFELIKKDKSHVWVEINTATIKQKENNTVVGFVRDIAERKRAEEAQHQSDEKYRLIVENSSDIIFTTTALEEFAYVSPSVTNILGYNPAELVGEPFISLVHPDDIPMMQAEIQRSYSLNSKFGLEIEYRVRHFNGEWRWVASKGTRVIGANGNFIYFIGIMRDMTALKQAAKERHQIEEKAQITSRLASVGEMAAGIAHEINNPLTAVLGFSQIILDGENVPEDIKENLIIIVNESQRVANIVKRLLTFARQTKPVKTSVNLNEVIDNTLKLRQYVLKTANINVVTNYDPELPCSVADPGQMQQVFLNLIVNAEQAMKKAHGKGILKITTKKTGNFINISFQDDGPGIARENMGHLFEPFFTTKDIGEGTGLGLSLSRSIVLEHGGQMSVESEPGRGATFIVELPIVDASPPGPENTCVITEVQPSPEKSGRILVVDDEPGVRALLDKVLTQIGYTVDTITNPGIAMDKLETGVRYDAILLDIRMPGMSGIELYTSIIEKMPGLKVKIIIITGDVMGPDIKNFLTKNNLSYLVKPFDIKLLKEKINEIIGSGQPAT
jgi:PAS domain S-box-containing protein